MAEWWRPDRLAARRGRLAARGRILAAVRQFFAAAGFVEVQTPALQASPGLEPHLKAFATTLHDPRDGGVRSRYLHTSPEFAMKKLLAGGMDKIWQLAPVFRDGERGATHHPEFAMLEWYRAGATWQDLVADCEALLRAAQAAAGAPPTPTPTLPRRRGRENAETPAFPWRPRAEGAKAPASSRRPGSEGAAAIALPPPAGEGASPGAAPGEADWGARLSWQGRSADARQPFERLSVADAFARYAGIDILATAPDPLRPDFALLAAAAERIGVRPHSGDDWESLYFRIFLDRIEPKLGVGAPTVLYGYPVSMAALSRKKPDDPRLAERFELYVCGLELANAFQELTDPAEQRARFVADQARKQALYGETYPIDEDFLAALAHGLPESAGIALGFDRLVMLCTGADHIDDVLWAPVD